jgi:hypothetical protein
MHYNWQVLVKADTEEGAISEAETTMDGLGGDGNVWDWYVVGGRWESNQNAVNAQEHKRLFWKRLKRAEKNQKRNLKSYRESLAGYLNEEGKTLEGYIMSEPIEELDGMIGHCLETIASLKAGYYITSSYLATSGDIWGSPIITKDVRCDIWANPSEYWLVTIDVHN